MSAKSFLGKDDRVQDQPPAGNLDQSPADDQDQPPADDQDPCCSAPNRLWATPLLQRRTTSEMTDAIGRGNVYTVTPGRRLVETFTNPVAKGMKRITEENWIQNFLQKESVEEQHAQQSNSADVANDDSIDANTDTLMDL
uniref:Uncharacterized protein n=1 Tax=Branchiostoma floridae TaxID=7739 RepID=C3Y828_BRAFL|eukprot:XP_002607487.1 hypothetical protein BRAFLDRAFT_69919 [Branchiostoma floridae]